MIQDLVCGVNLHYYASLQYGTAKAYIPSFVNNQILEVSLPNFYYDSNKGYSSSWISDVVDSVSNNLRNYITNNISDFGFLSFNNAYVNWAPTDLVNNWFTGSEFDLPLVCYIEDVEIEDSSSSAPDYTSILSSINTNLTNLNDKFSTTVSGSQVSICKALLNLFCVFSVESPLSNSSMIAGNNYIRKLVQILCSDINNQNTTSYIRRILLALCGSVDNVLNDGVTNKLQSIVNSLNQSVSPNASITDVISSLNTNIHNDLTEINTTTNNKDTVLIVDGQQDFVIRKQNNDDYDS